MARMLTMVLMLLTSAGVFSAPNGAEGSGASPLKRMLPAVTGTNLAGDKVSLPQDLEGEPSVLLIAYRRGTQVDVDRWITFIEKTMPEVTFLEVPTIASPVWRPLAGWIDGGMKRGVPEKRWRQVVTLYEDAPILRDFLGDFGGYNTHVLLLDVSGHVQWFYAGGFTEAAAEDLANALSKLDTTPSPEEPR